MKFRTYTYNPIFGIAAVIGLVIVLFPFLWEIKVSKQLLFIVGAILLILDLFIFINQFKKSIIIKKDGAFCFNFNNGKNEFLEFQKPYILKYFWGYNSYKVLFRVWNYSGKTPGYKKPVRIITCLNVYLKDKNGKEIIFYENLLPWQDAPSDWDYQVILSDSITIVRVFNVRKILNEFKKYSFQ